MKQLPFLCRLQFSVGLLHTQFFSLVSLIKIYAPSRLYVCRRRCTAATNWECREWSCFPDHIPPDLQHGPPWRRPLCRRRGLEIKAFLAAAMLGGLRWTSQHQYNPPEKSTTCLFNCRTTSVWLFLVTRLSLNCCVLVSHPSSFIRFLFYTLMCHRSCWISSFPSGSIKYLPTVQRAGEPLKYWSIVLLNIKVLFKFQWSVHPLVADIHLINGGERAAHCSVQRETRLSSKVRKYIWFFRCL